MVYGNGQQERRANWAGQRLTLRPKETWLQQLEDKASACYLEDKHDAIHGQSIPRVCLPSRRPSCPPCPPSSFSPRTAVMDFKRGVL